MTETQHGEYSQGFVNYLALLWGDGFMSAGGTEEVAQILAGLDVEDKRVLDIGCGTGGPTCFLVEGLKASRAVGVDVEPSLIEQARSRADQGGWADRVEFRVVAPDGLPFDEGAFDLVFSKDSIIHVADKARLFGEAYRVLQPGGRIAISDWLRGEQQFSSEMTRWVSDLGLTFEMWTLAQMAAAAKRAGFRDVTLDDRNLWYRDVAREELHRMQGRDNERLVSILGKQGAEEAISRLRLKAVAVEQGHLRPTHLRGRKPAR